MKLLRINIHGFKSFADKTTIDIKDGITGIVGPNGSGKSNIVDAVRWVLGEQSVKDIRAGSSMADVIFSGSKSRKSLSRAWVSLTFDNSDKYLKTDLNEVEIKRVVYSSGENEFYINNESARLKDITNLFIDSGSSVNSLSIISQGKIGDIINSKPQEKRFILEEAAGVLKYKKRKEETLRKLDKTNDNLIKINLIIDELTVNLDPLKEQAKVAAEYLEYKKDLEYSEISIISHDINQINNERNSYKERLDVLNDQIINMSSSANIDSNKVDKLKIDLLKKEEEISLNQEKLYKLTTDMSNLSSEKKVMIERKKYDAEDIKLETNLVNLKERELEYKNSIKLIENDIKNNEKVLDEKITINDKLKEELKTLTVKRDVTHLSLLNLNKEELINKNKIEILKNNIENDTKLPFAVKSILTNERLSGIHNTLGKLIETEEKYSTSIDIALGYTANVIVVEDESSARLGVNYLKSKNLGRVTFFPLSTIKPKGIEPNILSLLKDEDSFIGVASDLVSFNPLYRSVVTNQLGNTLIIDNLTNAIKISKIINNRYKIVTLSGDVISPGGSITGGSLQKSPGMSSDKFELEKLLILSKEKINQIKQKEEEINDIDYNLRILEDKVFEGVNNINFLREKTIRTKNVLSELYLNLNNNLNEQKGTEGILNNTVDKEVNNLLEKFYEVKSEKDNLEINLNKLKDAKDELQIEISHLELNNKKASAEYNKMINEQKDCEVNLTRLDTKLDNLLLRLNEEYGLTFERAYKEYPLLEDEKDIRLKVNSLKRNIKLLGDVNTGSIAEFERINERYTFLSNQKEDLNESINDILKAIDELDETMEEKLNKTFEELSSEFSNVFTTLFKGGIGKLKLTEPDDILNSGLEIMAEPPGKDIKNTKLLSGGESTLTAIALLFSILNIRTVPFCLLDEVEAALDESNVDIFGSYLKKLNTNTQFIIITHKKRTMEYVNNLYGVTMQESGISKLVSVKLD